MNFLLPFCILLAVGSSLAQPATFRNLGVDTSKRAIELEQILSGGPPPQGIPALGFEGDWRGATSPSPLGTFISQARAGYLADEAPVIVVTLNGETKAYPLEILTWHEIINDTVGGVPVAVTFCPLCNSALAFDRRVPLTAENLEALKVNPEAKPKPPAPGFLNDYRAQFGETEDIRANLIVSFGVSGLLYNSNLLMFDSRSSTLWSQLLGSAQVGGLTGTRLIRYPAPILSFAELKEAHPDAPLLSRDTGFNRAYGRNPYVGYDDADSPPFLFTGESDGRLPPKERVVSLDLEPKGTAYAFSDLQELKVVNDEVAGRPVAIFWQAGTSSALDRSSIDSSRDIGAVNVFDRNLDGLILTFIWQDGAFTDRETGSNWNLSGQAVAGELKGEQLRPIVHDNTLWFAWAAFKPETRLYRR